MKSPSNGEEPAASGPASHAGQPPSGYRSASDRGDFKPRERHDAVSKHDLRPFALDFKPRFSRDAD
jgi:hypothetical protein